MSWDIVAKILDKWRSKSEEKFDGNIPWASELDIQKYYTEDPNGWLLGIRKIGNTRQNIYHHLKSGLNQNVMVFSGAGYGATVGFVIPNILHIAEQLGDSLVVSDPLAEELYKSTSKRLEELGYEIKVFDPSYQFYDSIQYNPLDYVQTAEEAKKLADAIIQTANHMNSDLLCTSETVYLTMLLLYIKEVSSKKEQHLYSVHQLATHFKENPSDIAFLFDCLPKESEAKRMRRRFKECSFKQETLSKIKKILDDWVLNDFSRLNLSCEFTFRELGQRKIALFIFDKGIFSSSYLSILIGQMIQELSKEARKKKEKSLEIPVRFLLDESEPIATVYNLSQTMKDMNHIGISYVCFNPVYDLEPESEQNKNWIKLMEACDTICVFGSSHPHLGDYIASYLEEETLYFKINHHAEKEKYQDMSMFPNRKKIAEKINDSYCPSGLYHLFQRGRSPLLLEAPYYFHK